jgi:diazepam-binding inhibitor (GABA receptor modulating acyl-CoA-binding protein)
MNNSDEFSMAVNIVKHLHKTPDNNELLKLYGLFKQSTIGDNMNKKPLFIDIKAVSKHNAWMEQMGKDKHTTEVEYITLVNELITKYGIIEE